VVDDVSTDNSIEILNRLSDKFIANDIEFKFIKSSKKLYCGSAYNLAFKNATGSYLGILDSDDMLEDFACKFIVDIYERYPEVAWIYTQYNKYNRKMDRVLKKGFCHYPGRNKSILQIERKNINVYGHWRTFSDRINDNKDLFGRGLRCSVDKHLGIRLEEEGIGMFVNKVCYKYRSRTKGEQSIVFSYSLRKTKEKVVEEAKKRRKNKKIYPILEFK
jgi:glycosyltransferase involved in cell wall biosynthesis